MGSRKLLKVGNTGLDEDTPLFESNGHAEVDVEKAFGTTFGRFKNANVFCPFCEKEGQSKTPSCSVNIDGYFVCKSCGAKGRADKFYAQRMSMPLRQARGELDAPVGYTEKLRSRVIKPKPLHEDLIKRTHNNLLRSVVELAYLTGPARGLSVSTIKAYQLGCDEYRITIPVRDRVGLPWGIRRYLPNAVGKPKMVSHVCGRGDPCLYPWQNLDKYAASDQGYVILCEGEFDCLLAIQNGFDALTVTSGVTTWTDEFTVELLTLGKPIVIVYDVNDRDTDPRQNDLGQKIARHRAALLREAGLTVRVVELPLKYEGGDLTDWFMRAGKTAKELSALINDSNEFTAEDAEEGLEEGKLIEEARNDKRSKGTKSVRPISEADLVVKRDEDSPLVTLHEASLAQYFFRSIRLKCLVAGRTSAPYLFPTKVQIDIPGDEDDADSVKTIVHTFDPWDGAILSLIKCTTGAQHRYIRARLGVDPKLKATVTVLESLNVEEVALIPAIDHEQDQGPYVMRQAYYVGHGLQPNHVYDMLGYTLPDPRTQCATHIITEATPAATDLDNFQLTVDQFKQLRRAFRTKDLFEKFDHIAGQFASHITRIYGRADLHTSVDLVFHSPLSFDFDGTRLRKGWLDVLVLGDTRTGKGFVAEGLSRHYGVGEVVSAENTSFAGIIGGIQKVNENQVLCWGKIPLADKRLVVIDEASNLTYDQIGKMSRIRSEGVVEITKIITEKTSARTRLIWLSNPRPPAMGRPKKMSEYTFGVQAVPELIGNAEDIARFDYVLTVAHGEVDSKLINSSRGEEEGKEELVYTSELCRKLIVWIWSRKPEQILFEEDVVEYTMRAADDIGRKFSSSICLIQAEDVRFKLARIACAAAGRTFSTDDGKTLIVRKEHVEFAYNFLHHIYSKPSCGYAQLSAAERERSTLRDPKDVLVCLQQVGNLFSDLVSGLLEQQTISARDLCDYAGVDIYQARSIISELVRLRAITKDAHWYIKKPAFKAFLQELKTQLNRDPEHITLDDDEEFVADIPEDE